MSVSLYYAASRALPLTAAEAAAVERVVAAALTSFPYEDEECLHLYEGLHEGRYGGGGEPGRLLAGSTKMPLDPERALPVILHVLGSVTELRRALPGAAWHVHLDDLDVPWDEDGGYAL
ncbi:hypothetical protein ACFV6F_23215 [Kitasatospora phosalacinea]|uniref:hypothetical protein n=1 Tax=Kitasatospora phosalacinea TaxID=2065 RepID=UPI003668B697